MPESLTRAALIDAVMESLPYGSDVCDAEGALDAVLPLIADEIDAMAKERAEKFMQRGRASSYDQSDALYRPARRTGNRWATAIQGHAGFPDLVLARAGVVLFRELKGYDRNGRLGKLSSEQRDWSRQLLPRTPLDALCLDEAGRRVRMALVFDVWTPDDWPLIVATLTARVEARSA